jgi:hypothetical protein
MIILGGGALRLSRRYSHLQFSIYNSQFAMIGGAAPITGEQDCKVKMVN